MPHFCGMFYGKAWIAIQMTRHLYLISAQLWTAGIVRSSRTLANFKVPSETVVGWTRASACKKSGMFSWSRIGVWALNIQSPFQFVPWKRERTLKRTKVAYLTRICCNVLIGRIKACTNGRYLIIRPREERTHQRLRTVPSRHIRCVLLRHW